MTIVKTNDKHYKAIADTLREYGQGDTKFFPQEMPQGIINNCNGFYNQGLVDGYENGEEQGYNVGYNDGHNDGYNEGLVVGVENGEKSQYNEFWDTYQDNGNRTHYSYAFSGQQWGIGNIFKPKYDIKPIYADYMFSNWFSNSNVNIDLAERLKECRVVLDTSQCTSFKYFLQYGSTRHLPSIDTRSATSLANFSVNSSVNIIDKIILKDDGSQIVRSMFVATHPGLTNITFEGVIGTDFSVSMCPVISVASLNNIISCLKDLTDTGQTLILTLGVTNLAKLTDAEKAIATEKGWTLA